MSNTDDLLRRVERRAAALTIVFAVVALVVPGGGALAAAAVLGGAFVSAVSYWAIRRGVDGVADRMVARAAREPGEEPRAGRPVRGVFAFVIRYALLAGIAYVMIARLRLPPIGLLSGASVIPAAAAVEIVRRRR